MLREGCELKKVEGWNGTLQDAETDRQALTMCHTQWDVSQPNPTGKVQRESASKPKMDIS